MKVVVADFTTDNLDLVKLKVNQDESIDKELGTLLFHKDGKQAQYFINKGIDYNQGVVDLLAKCLQIAFADMQVNGIINDLNVYVVDATDEDLKKVVG